MEDKKVKAGSVAVGICLFVIAILLVLIVVFFYNSTIEKNNLQAEVNNLQEKINSISNTINSNKNEISDSKIKDIILDGMYSLDYGEYGSDIIWNFSKDGKAAVGGNMYVYQGTYKTIRENYIEVHYIKHKIWDDETNKETVKTIDEYEYISIEDNNIYLTDSNGQKSKIKRLGDVVSENFE